MIKPIPGEVQRKIFTLISIWKLLNNERLEGNKKDVKEFKEIIIVELLECVKRFMEKQDDR